MSTSQPTCKERIAEQMASREVYVRDLQDKSNASDQTGEDAQEELDSFPLAIDTREVTTILLSYGGPSDELEVIHNGADIDSVTYIFKDWFDGARESVDSDSALYAYAESIIESLQS